MIGRRRMLAATVGLGVMGAASGRAEEAGVVIGVINDMAGPYADLGGPGSVIAARMAVEDAGGAVLGQPIRILSADHKNRADLATQLTSDWMDRSGVTAVADGGASGAGLAIQEVARRKKRIFLATGPATSDLTGSACSPYGFHWTYDTHALAAGTAATLMARGGKSWFFITADYAFGASVQRDTTALIDAGGGKVVGSVRSPIGASDFSSYILQAQSSGADVVGLALGGEDLVNAVKQSVDFGLTKTKALAGLLTFNTDVAAIGQDAAQGLVVTTSYDWGIDPAMHAFGERFMARSGGKPPSMVQAGTYSGVAHYLKAVKAAGTVDADAVAGEMRKMPVNDFMTHDAPIRPDGLVMRSMYVVAVKPPKESKGPWDLFSLLATIPGETAFASMAAGKCPLTKPG